MPRHEPSVIPRVCQSGLNPAHPSVSGPVCSHRQDMLKVASLDVVEKKPNHPLLILCLQPADKTAGFQPPATAHDSLFGSCTCFWKERSAALASVSRFGMLHFLICASRRKARAVTSGGHAPFALAKAAASVATQQHRLECFSFYTKTSTSSLLFFVFCFFFTVLNESRGWTKMGFNPVFGYCAAGCSCYWLPRRLYLRPPVLPAPLESNGSAEAGD